MSTVDGGSVVARMGIWGGLRNPAPFDPAVGGETLVDLRTCVEIHGDERTVATWLDQENSCGEVDDADAVIRSERRLPVSPVDGVVASESQGE